MLAEKGPISDHHPAGEAVKVDPVPAFLPMAEVLGAIQSSALLEVQKASLTARVLRIPKISVPKDILPEIASIEGKLADVIEKDDPNYTNLLLRLPELNRRLLGLIDTVADIEEVLGYNKALADNRGLVDRVRVVGRGVRKIGRRIREAVTDLEIEVTTEDILLEDRLAEILDAACGFKRNSKFNNNSLAIRAVLEALLGVSFNQLSGQEQLKIRHELDRYELDLPDLNIV